MHYSKYIKCNRAPVVSAPPVVKHGPTIQQAQIVSTPNNITSQVTTPLQAFQEVNPATVEIPVMALPKPNNTPTNPIMDKMEQLFSNRDPVTTMKLNKMLGLMIDEMEGRLEEPETILSEDEANRVMEYFTMLEDKYFSDIIMSERPSKLFVWNIPRSYYEDMVDAIDKGRPDYLNPMFLLYLAMTDYPGLAIPHFIKILMDLGYDDANQLNMYEQQYLDMLTDVDDEPDDEGIHFDDTDDDE